MHFWRSASSARSAGPWPSPSPRADAPEALAFRFLKLLNQLKFIDPLFANWYLFTSETVVEPFDMNPVSLTKTIAEAIWYDDDGNPEWYNGYHYGAFNFNTFEPNARGFKVGFQANNLLPGPYFLNHVGLETSYGIAPEDNVVTFRLFRAALLAIVEAWEPTWCIAFPSRSMIFGRSLPTFIWNPPG